MKKLILIPIIMILTSFSVLAIVGHPANQVFPGLFASGNYTFGTNVLFIDDTNDRVGIGTRSPLSKLEIKGAANSGLRITDSSGNVRILLQPSGTEQGEIFMANGSNVTTVVISSFQRSYFNGGNVGIGTSSPTRRLHVYTSDDGDFATFIQNAHATGGLGLGVRAGDSASEYIAAFYNKDAALKHGFYADGSVYHAGNVGIGESAPDGILHIKGVFSDNLMGTGGETGTGYSMLWGGVAGSSRWGFRVATSANSEELYLDANLAGTPLTVMTWDKVNGNVGIGTTDPVTTLDVNSGTVGSTGLANSASRAAAFFQGFNALARGIAIGADNPTGNPSIQAVDDARTGSMPLLINPYGGNVGIGTTSPVSKLEVEGTGSTYMVVDTSASSVDTGIIIQSEGATDWLIRNSASNSDSLYVINLDGAGVILADGATSWSATSDERIKENWIELTDAVSKVNTLRAGTYNLIGQNTNDRKVGLIAQDLSKVLPEAVDSIDPDKLGIRYTEVVPLLTKAIQEQQNQIEELKAIVCELKPEANICEEV